MAGFFKKIMGTIGLPVDEEEETVENEIQEFEESPKAKRESLENPFSKKYCQIISLLDALSA